MGRPSSLTVPQRGNVVVMLLRRDQPATKLAKRFGISEQTLYRWRHDFIAAGQAALAAGKGGLDPRHRDARQLKKELAARDQLIAELTIANWILKTNGPPLVLNETMRKEIRDRTAENDRARITGVLSALDIATSTWYSKRIAEEHRRRPGPPPKPVPEAVVQVVAKMATENPMYGYKQIATMCRRRRQEVSDRQAYRVMREHGLLHR